MKEVELTVEGMSCGHCVKAVTKAIQAHDAAAVVKVNLESRNVSVASTLSPEALRAAIAEAGFKVL